MAERYDFYVHDNRKITFNLTEPIMREDSGVTDFVFHIPKILNELEVSDWAWWLVFVNAKKEKYSVALTLSDDPERPLEYNLATYTVDYAMSIKAGAVQFALEAINAGTGGVIDNEWHTLTYETKVKETLQGNQAEYAETESDIISALLEEVRTKMNQVIGGATPTPVSAVSQMTDTSKLYLLTTDGEWYYYNGSAWASGGVYGAGVVDSAPTQGSTNAVSSGGVYEEIDGLKEDLGITNIALGTAQNGYYSGNNGDTITFTSASNSRAYQIDLSSYIGKTVNVKIQSGGTTSTRKTAICTSEGVIGKAINEGDIIANSNGVTFDITSDYNQLYTSAYANGAGGYTLNVVIISALSLDVLNIENQLHTDAVYVDSGANSSGDGTKTAPFKTIQEGIDSGAVTVRVKAGSYAAFKVSNRDYPLTVILDEMPDYQTTPQDDVPKIKITSATGTTGYGGVQISNCVEIVLSDIWVNAVSRYGFDISNVKSLEMTRCYANSNSTTKFSLFRFVNVNGVIRDCIAWDSKLDGFNIHGFGNTQFINCIAYNCDDDGISHHDACTGSVIGGEFYNCGKGGVSTPYGGAKIDIHGVYSHDNTRYGLYCDSDSNHADIYARVEGCVFVDNGTADIYAADGTVIAWNNIYNTKSIQPTATFVEYPTA